MFYIQEYRIVARVLAVLLFTLSSTNNHMKQVGTYNKIPDTLKVTPLTKGQVILYRLLDPVIDPTDPLKQKLIWKKAVKIPTLDVIADPATGAPIEIGVVDRVDRDNVPTIKTFWARGMENNGYFSLTGGQGHDDYFYWMFELTNYNKSNPNRDQTVEAKFERVDRVGDAKKGLKKLDDELNALIYVRDMDVKDLKNLAAAMMWDENDAVDILRERAKELAKADALKFSAIVRSKDVEIKAILKRAYDKGDIKYNVQQNKVQWGSNNETIATLQRIEGQDWLSQMADWIKTAKNGDKTYEAIKRMANKETEVVA